MKATRTNFKDMWENHFDNYPGWLYVADCICPTRERQKQEEKASIQVEECNSSFILSDYEDISSDKLYPVDKQNGYMIDCVQSEVCNSHDESKTPDANLDTVQEKCSENNNTAKASEEIRTEKIVHCRPLTSQPGDIIFECDTGLGFAFVTKKEESLFYTPHRTCVSKTLGTISIDTTCLKKPKIKVLFSCNIYFKPRSGQGTSQLEFILYRSCNNCTESPLGNWIFDLEDKSEQLSQTFKFSFCNCNAFPGFYNYFIRVIPVCIKNCSVLLTNCHMDAFAQSK